MSEMVERFWNRVAKAGDDECWLWRGQFHKTKCGISYGYFYDSGKCRRAHRVAYELWNVVIPLGAVIRHSCDNGLCCNPKHLIAGTQKENVADRYARGRDNHVRGSAHGVAKLTEDQARAIFSSPLSNKRLASLYGVSNFTVMEIKHGKRWQHIHD